MNLDLTAMRFEVTELNYVSVEMLHLRVQGGNEELGGR